MYGKELKLAIEAAAEAGKYLAGIESAEIDSAAGKDIKLVNDLRSEEIIIDVLRKTKFPILSEERGLIQGDDNYDSRYWIVDPIDGSANFWKKMKELTCVSIALWENGQPVLGVVYRYHMEELFCGVVGEAAWMNGKEIHTSDTVRLENAVLATGFPVKGLYDENSLKKYFQEAQCFKKIRMLGSAALMGAFVSCGRLDAYSEDGIMIWDIAASAAIVKAAGGVTDVSMIDGERCACRLFSNKSLYDRYMDRIDGKK